MAKLIIQRDKPSILKSYYPLKPIYKNKNDWIHYILLNLLKVHKTDRNKNWNIAYTKYTNQLTDDQKWIYN